MIPLKYDSPLKGILVGLCGQTLKAIDSLFFRRSGPLFAMMYGFLAGAPLMAETITGPAIVIDGRTPRGIRSNGSLVGT